MAQPTRPTQPSIPPGSVNEYVIHVIYTGVETIKRETTATYGCTTAGKSVRVRAWTAKLPVHC